MQKGKHVIFPKFTNYEILWVLYGVSVWNVRLLECSIKGWWKVEKPPVKVKPPVSYSQYIIYISKSIISRLNHSWDGLYRGGGGHVKLH